MNIVALLLAAGRAERFGGAKLLARIPAGPDAGSEIGVVALRRLRAAIPDVVAVVRPGDVVLAKLLESEGARVIVAARASEGMGASLAAAVAAAPDADGYIVALADMPWIEPGTIARVVDALAGGASLAAPRHRGERGHPVGFSAVHRAALLALRGDEGAKEIVAAHRDALVLFDVDDPGVLRDIDDPHDLI